MLQWFIRFFEFAEITEFNENFAPFREFHQLAYVTLKVNFHTALIWNWRFYKSGIYLGKCLQNFPNKHPRYNDDWEA